MYLKEVTLENVRLFSNVKFSFKEGVNEVVAPNRAGKTTLADAVSFLLTGKLYSGSANIALLKPVDDTSKKVVVSGTFVLSDGSEVVFRKEYQENWVTTRGTSEQKLDGHTTNLFINGVKKLQKDYEKEIAQFFAIPDLSDVTSQELIQGLSQAYYLNETLPWAKLRSIINKIIGVVEPADIFDRATNTKVLEPMLAKVNFKIADLRKKHNVELGGYNEHAKTLKAQIEGDVIENPVDEESFTKAAQEVVSLEKQILDLRVKKNGILNPVIEKLNAQLQKINESLLKSQQLDNTELAKKNAAVAKNIEKLRNDRAENNSKITETKAEIAALEKTVKSNEATINTNKALITQKEAQKQVKLEEYYKEEASVYVSTPSSICPQCGFDLSAEINAAGREQFNNYKAERIKSIVAQGHAINAEIERFEAQNKELKEKNDELSVSIKSKQKTLEELEAKASSWDGEISKNESEKIYYFESEETKKLKESIQSTRQAIAEENNRSTDTAAIDAQVETLNEKKEAAQAVVDEYQAQKRITKRKNDREKELIKVNENIFEAMATIDNLNQYTATWLNIVSERIQAKFGNIKFRLIQENIKEGSWNEVCEVMIDTPLGEVPYSTANTEAKIRVGVMLADKIAEHLNIAPLPMWVDDCEHITVSNRIFETRSQLFLLIAEEPNGEDYLNQRIKL